MLAPALPELVASNGKSVKNQVGSDFACQDAERKNRDKFGAKVHKQWAEEKAVKEFGRAKFYQHIAQRFAGGEQYAA